LELRLLLELEERFCCTAVEELPLARELLPEVERFCWTAVLPEEDRELEEPEPVDRLLEEELEDRLLCEEVLRLLLEERVCATMFSDISMERTSIREVANVIILLMASQF
jgi:hypothetical protein